MTDARHPYFGKRVALATIHEKDRAFAAPFRRVLGAEVVVARDIDTDKLGTFSGDIPRPGPLDETCLAKAALAVEGADADCALASEGSYGPIGNVPLVPGGVEIVAFVDRKRGVRFVETLVTHRTNWRIWRFRPGDPTVLAAAKAIGFPKFGIFVMRNSDYGEPHKNIATIDELVAAVAREGKRSDDGMALLISDMRAHRNPTRMQVLRAVGWKVAKRLERLCPRCEAPGFGHIESRRGLPCEGCGEATHWIDFEVDGCTACGHAAARPRKDGRRTAPRLSCSACR
jgi:hypothetical protein